MLPLRSNGDIIDMTSRTSGAPATALDGRWQGLTKTSKTDDGGPRPPPLDQGCAALLDRRHGGTLASTPAPIKGGGAPLEEGIDHSSTEDY